MKHLLYLLFLLPLAANSQSGPAKRPAPRTELGFNLGHAFDNAFDGTLQHGGYIRSSVSLLTNAGPLQYGLTIEGGTNGNDYWYLSPAALLNRRFSMQNAYFYAGAMAGYVCSDDMLKDHFTKQRMAQGYVFGLQGGWVQPVGRHIAFTSELAVRSTQLWTTFGGESFKTQSGFTVYFPVTIGIRYGF